MGITTDVPLPELHELKTDEVNMSASTLLTASPYIGKMCESVNNEFVLCRQEKNDPRECLILGKQVTECTIGVLSKIKNECLHEFKQYSNCVDKSSGDYTLRHCRKTQKVFDDCMQNKLCVSRPDFGYFCRGRIHASVSPAPPGPPCPCQPKVADPTPAIPDSKPRLKARFGARLYWTTE